MRTRTWGPVALLLVLLSACGSTSAAESTAAAEPTPSGTATSPVTLHSRPDAPAAACTGLETPVTTGSTKAATSKRSMPDKVLRCLDDGPGLSLAKLRGPALVNVWASWCGPCSEEMPHLVAVESQMRDQVRFVGLNLSDDPADARTWNKFHDVTWPSLRDESGKIRGPLRFPGPPVTFFVRSDGGIAGVHYGAFTSSEQVREALSEYLGVESGTSEAPA